MRTGSDPSTTERGSSLTRHASLVSAGDSLFFSSAARPMKSPLSSLTQKPNPAWYGSTSGVMSEPHTRYPFSRRRESTAL